MFRKKLKQIGAVFLAFCMVSGAVWTPGIGADAADTALTDFVNGLTAPTIAPGGAALNMPGNLPSGASIRFCADYDQVIDEDGTIYTPLQAKTIKGFYEVYKLDGDGEVSDSAKSAEFTVSVPGQYTDGSNANAKPDVIPELQEWHGAAGGNFIASVFSRIVVGSSELKDVANTFAENYKEITGLDIGVVSGTRDDVKMGDFFLTLGSADVGLGEEGYRLSIGDAAVVEAAQPTGAHWGTISILQILKQTGGSIPKGEARDYPKYEVRAFSLDVGRKPFSLDSIYQFAKNMSWYKMNSFQVHLSDNLIFMEDYKTMAGGDVEAGLQLALEKTYSGFRLESGVLNSENKSATSEDMYYTKDEFRQFIKDSRAMGVNIVPEFDMPAHARPFTKAFPEYMTSSPKGGQHVYTIDELNLDEDKIDDTIAWAQSIWQDYFDGENPVFDEETTIHIGTDEYHGTGGNTGFRKFSDEMIKFVQGTGRNVRMWGSLSNKGGINGTPRVTSKDVQLNIWETGSYANPTDMYNAGFDLINTLYTNYIVPGNTGGEGSYGDYRSLGAIYRNWRPNVISNFTAKAGDDQMLGGCYALWHDNIDTRANGNSEYDSFVRFLQPLPAYSAKLWGEASKEYDAFAELADKTGTAPGTKIISEVDSIGKEAAKYTFDESMEQDASGNGYDLTEMKNVEQVSSDTGKALQLKGGESYAESPLDVFGSGASLTMKVKMDADAEGEQILCESKDAFGTYGTYAIKAVQKNTGKVGFSREGYDYSFNYTLPKGKWVELMFCGGNNTAELYVNGELVDNNPDMYFENHPDRELTAALPSNIKKVVTLMIPFGRVGSATKSFKGQIDSVAVGKELEVNDERGLIPQNQMEASACSEAPEAGNEGPARFVLDGNPDTFWHSNWSNDLSLSDEDHHKVSLTFKDGNPRTVAKLTYLPRQDRNNGRILQYRVLVEKADGTTVTVADGEWADNASRKTAVFEPVEARKVTLKIDESISDDVGVHGTIAELNLYEQTEVFNGEKLQEELNKYADFKEGEYTDISWKAFMDVRETVLAVINKPDSTEEECLYACEKLQQAVEKLTVKPIENKLSDAVKEAEQADAGDYTSEGFAEYQAEAENLKNILSNPNATEEQKIEAWNSLQTKKAELVNISEIKKAVAEEADVSGCTYASAETYKKALADAKNILAKPNATKTEIDTALAALRRAEEELAPKTVDDTEMIKAVKDAENQLKDTSGYTEESVEALKKALSEALSVLRNPAAAQPEIDKALKKLRETKLVKKSSGGTVQPNPQPTPPGFQPTPSPEPQPKVPAKGTVAVSKDKVLEFKVTKSDAKDGTVAVSKLRNKNAKRVKIPATVVIDGYTFKVTAIQGKVFQKCKKLASVELGSNVASIGSNAFFGSKKLKTVTLKGTKVPKLSGKKVFKGTAAKCKVTAPKKMSKKQFKALKTKFRKAGMGKKAVYKQK